MGHPENGDSGCSWDNYTLKAFSEWITILKAHYMLCTRGNSRLSTCNMHRGAVALFTIAPTSTQKCIQMKGFYATQISDFLLLTANASLMSSINRFKSAPSDQNKNAACSPSSGSRNSLFSDQAFVQAWFSLSLSGGGGLQSSHLPKLVFLISSSYIIYKTETTRVPCEFSFKSISTFLCTDSKVQLEAEIPQEMIQKYSWKQRNCIDMNENNEQCSLFCPPFCNELRFHAQMSKGIQNDHRGASRSA